MVEAAGGIVFRWRTDGIMKFSDSNSLPDYVNGHAALDNIEVCVVHRPKYDDWSWPKGKLEPNESHRHAAVREMGEETGVPVSLGAYLGDVEYPMDDEGRDTKSTKRKTGEIKHVQYWMAYGIDVDEDERRCKAFGPVHLTDRHEIDQCAWVNIWQAHDLLSRTRDQQILDIFVRQVQLGAAQARNIIILRHAKAEPRRLWKGEESDRPITPRGAAVAYALNRELACFNPTQLVSSPWRRCLETLEFFSWQTGYEIETSQELTEHSFGANPDKAWQRFTRLIDDAFDTERCTVVCLHRPVIGGFFRRMRDMCASKPLAAPFMKKSPYMPTGEALVLVVTDTPDGHSIIDIQRIHTIVD